MVNISDIVSCYADAYDPSDEKLDRFARDLESLVESQDGYLEGPWTSITAPIPQDWRWRYW